MHLKATVLAALVTWPLAGYAAHAATGARLVNAELPTLGGGKHGYLGKAGASVFIFFQPGQEHSRATLVEMTRCAQELSGRPIHWAAIVSGKYPKAEVEAQVKSTALTFPVLIDQGDELYARLGVILHPMVGIADAAHLLVAFQPFTKVNYCERVKAHVLHTLKELSDQELEKVLNPPAATQGGTTQEARRNLKLGELMLKAGNFEKAMESARKALEKDRALAAVHSLLDATLAGKGDCPGASKAFEAALKLDPKDPRGLEGPKGCAK